MVDHSSDINMEKLILTIQKFPQLYDKSHRDYKDKDVKNNIWLEIGEILETNARDANDLWSRLREKYVREKKLLQEDCKSGGGSSKRKLWDLFPLFGFLEPHIRKRRTYSNLMAEIPSTSMQVAVSTSHRPSVDIKRQQHLSSSRSGCSIDSMHSSHGGSMESLQYIQGFGGCSNDSVPYSHGSVESLECIPDEDIMIGEFSMKKERDLETCEEPALPKKKRVRKDSGKKEDPVMSNLLSVMETVNKRLTNNSQDEDTLFALTVVSMMKKLKKNKKKTFKKEILLKLLELDSDSE